MPSRLELTLIPFWLDALDVERIDPHDDFFRLGGDSLAAVRMLGAVEELLLTYVPFDKFLEEPTVSGLARQIAAARSAPATATAATATAATGAGRVPASDAQRRLWFLDQAGAGSAYNLPLGFRLRGGIDVAAFDRSFAEVVRRHAALQTTFAEEEGAPVKVVGEAPEPTVEVIDLRAEPDPAAVAEIRLREVVAAPFDLARGPLVRAARLVIADDDQVFVAVIHHIVCDGWSLAVVGAELGALYRAFTTGRPADLPVPPAPVPRNESDDGLEWWRRRLEGAPPALELPADRPRPAESRYFGATLREQLSDQLAARVRDFSRQEGITPFVTLLAAYAAALGRHSGQDTVVVGITTSGRERAEEASAVDFLARTLAVRVDLADAATFRSLARRVSEGVREALAHQHVPFERIVADAGVERDLSRHPIFQAFFAQVPPVVVDVDGVTPYPVAAPGARFDLTLLVEGDAAAPALAWEYDADLFDQETIADLAQHYATLLDAGLAEPDEPVAALPLMSEAERLEVLSLSAAAEPDARVACLHEVFASQAAQTPHAPALVFEGAILTYRQLEERANQLAHRLLAEGVGHEDVVALCLEPSLETVVAILATLKAGAAYLPLDPEHPPDRLAHMLADSGARALVAGERLLPRVALPGTRTICPDRDAEALAREPREAPPAMARPDSLAYIIYTSGSSGRPKGVQLEHRHVARLFATTEEWFRFGPSDTWTLLHSYGFDFSVWEMWGALLYGGKLVVPSRWTVRAPEALARLIATERVTVLNVTPSLFGALSEHLLEAVDYLQLRTVIFGGEALRPAALAPWFERLGDRTPRFVNMYGITETTVHTTYRPMRPDDVGLGASPIGTQLPDLELHILDARGTHVPLGVPGEIFVGGAGVARGYLNRPELTAERFVPNPFGPGRLYRTGDRARRRRDGDLEYLGRLDAQVKVRGHRIELGEVERVLLEHPTVADAAVVAVDVAPGDTRLAAYLVCAAGSVPDDLRAHLESRLPSYMIPASVSALDALPRTTNGKLDRARLPATASDDEPDTPYAPARTDTEREVAAVWADVLGVDHVGAHDSFFSLGGHSLLAARIATRLRERLGIPLSVRAVLEEPVLSAFAARVEAARKTAGEDAAGDHAQPEPTPSSVEPLAFTQRQLLFFDAVTPGHPVYNAGLVVDVQGPLDVAALRGALEDAVERHEPLRTVFVRDDDTEGQRVLRRWSLDLPVVDMTHVPADEAHEDLTRRLRAEARRPFDLGADVLLRPSVFRLGPDRHVLLLATHHVAIDGWSVAILFEELGELYGARVEGRPAALQKLEHRFVDFARWQRARLDDALLEREAEYWRAALAGAPNGPPLAPDRPRPPRQTFAGDTLELRLGPELARAVRELSAERAVTPYMLLLAAFGALLGRAGGSDDLVFGTPVANREDPAFDRLVGHFANTSVIRLRLGGNPTFAELLDRARTATLEAYEHAVLPFDLIVSAARVPRDPSANPLFGVNFRVRVGGPPELRLAGATTKRMPLDLEIARFDLALEVHVLEEALECEFNYSTDLYAPQTVARLAAGFSALLETVVRDPDTRLLSLPLQEPDAAGGAEIRRYRARRGGVSAL